MADTFSRAPPPKDALEYFRSKGWKFGWDWRDVWKEEHAVNFTVAKAMQLDMLTDIRAAIDLALEQGETFETFQKTLQPLLAHHGWWGHAIQTDPLTGEEKIVEMGTPRRLRIIYDNNLRTARAAGQWQRIQNTQDAFPYLLRILGPSREHRPEHSQMHGTCLPVGDAFWQVHMPPDAWGCKCRVRQISRQEYDRLRQTGIQVPPSADTMIMQDGLPTGHHREQLQPIKTTAPTGEPQNWLNKRTGQTETVPWGCDPGWGWNPGEVSRLTRSLTTFKDKTVGVEATLVVAAIRDLIDAGVLERWFANPHGSFPLVVLPEADATAIGAKERIGQLSADTLGKQQKRHPELTAQEYADAQRVIDHATAKVQDTAVSMIYVLDAPEAATGGYVLVVKATQSGNATFVTSYRRLSREQAMRDTEIGRLLEKGKKQ